jgi:hypothetical protein
MLREWTFNALLLAISLGIIYAGAEAYVSIDIDDGMQFDLEMWRYSRSLKQVSANPRLGHEHRPNSRAHLMGVDVAINSDGLRDREISVARTPGTTRIMMLGDSLTFGWGVPAENTYSKRLETKLREAGHSVEVINTGVGNYNTSMEVEYFLTRGAKYRPDIVVLNYFINDAEKTPQYETNILNRNLRAYVYFASRVDTALRQSDMASRSDWKEYYASLYDEKTNPEGLASMRAAVARLAEYCKKESLPLYLVNYPELRVLKEYPFPFVDKLVRSLADSNGARFLNLLPAVKNLEPASLWVTAPDPHPSVVAHEAFASAMFAYFDGELARAGAGALSTGKH